ncbi:MAG: PAS domain S-box protein [Desulfobulbaceae bacterium]|nr:PAS domain S-box protein [Desulfobulbaceae bacterium]
MKDERARIEVYVQRYKLLREISELQVENHESENDFLHHCCSLLLQDPEYCLIWVERPDPTGSTLLTVVAKHDLPSEQGVDLVQRYVTSQVPTVAPASSSTSVSPLLSILNPADPQLPAELRRLMDITGSRFMSCWPMVYAHRQYGRLCIHSICLDCCSDIEVDFIANVAASMSHSLYLYHTAQHLRREQDFNSEIVATVQALLVSLSHCGEILSFNQIAQNTTGYSEGEVKGKFWVDILISPEKRVESQNRFVEILKDHRSSMTFQAELQTRSGGRRIIKWHSSILPDVEQGRVGVVLFGQDITETVEASLALNHAVDKWENIFASIQDPALIVLEDGTIVDVNPAALVCAKRKREEVVGHGVCEILHGGRSAGTECPLELQLKKKKSHIFETELHGFHGNFLLTVSPLHQYENIPWAALLLARDLTEEQLMRSEAIRAAQLASVGELAAGVAHEINNPINGIINYAQILLDAGMESGQADFLQKIVKEGKRIAGITRNLLEYSRKGEDVFEAVDIILLCKRCRNLIQHQYHLDGISIQIQHDEKLPAVCCNTQHIQQVLLNIFSNARYALNERYPATHHDKRIDITSKVKNIGQNKYVQLSVTDYGTGIEQHVMGRLMDPFFSTKQKHQGTGLGLSISHSLIKKNNGFFRVKSQWGEWTTVLIELPAAGDQEHVKKC